MLSDLIQTIDVLTKDEVAECLRMLDVFPYEPTTVFGMSGCEVNNQIRTNSRICVPEGSDVANLMHKGMNDALIEYRNQISHINEQFEYFPVPGSYRTNCYREPIQVLKYETSEFYRWHYDAATDANAKEYHRAISIVLYLTEDFEGGCTQFPHRTYKPKAGQALIFPSNWCFPHQAQPVTSGTKIAAVTWYSSYYDFT